MQEQNVVYTNAVHLAAMNDRSLVATDGGRLLQIPDEKVWPVLKTDQHRPTRLSPLTRATDKSNKRHSSTI